MNNDQVDNSMLQNMVWTGLGKHALSPGFVKHVVSIFITNYKTYQFRGVEAYVGFQIIQKQ